MVLVLHSAWEPSRHSMSTDHGDQRTIMPGRPHWVGVTRQEAYRLWWGQKRGARLLAPPLGSCKVLEWEGSVWPPFSV